jgi:hypothetical protein
MKFKFPSFFSHFRRIWTCWPRTALSFTLANSYASRILALNGVVGASSSFCYLIITVSRLDWGGSTGRITLFSDCDAIPVVLTKPKEKEGLTKYHVNRRVGFIAHFPSRAP